MGGQNIKRREALRVIGIASVAAGFPGFRQWAFACGHAMPSAVRETQHSGPYRQLFFSEPHYKLIARLAEMIIPSDDGPGAREAGVAEFIDFMVANRVAVTSRREIRCTEDAIEEGNATQNRFIDGIGWVNARSISEFGHEFLEATSEQQNALLEEVAYQAKYKPGTEDGREFFQLMRDYTVGGFYTSRVGLEALGYPGLQTAWPSMPGCAHPDDPEHVHLSEAFKAAGR